MSEENRDAQLSAATGDLAKAIQDLELFIGEVDGSEAAEGGTIDGTEAAAALDVLRSTIAQPQTVPEGYALVPLKPTEEMVEAGCDNNPTQWNEGTDRGFPADVANDVYVSMVRAACSVTRPK